VSPAAAGRPRVLVTAVVGTQRDFRVRRSCEAAGVPDPLRFDPIQEAARQWHEHWGSATVAPMTAVTSIMRLHQIVLVRLNELLGPHDLTFARYEALMLLYYSRRGELPLGKISDRLQVHRASVTNVIDKLCERGYVDRVQHEHDRRTVLARISGEGRRVARRSTKVLNDAGFGMEPLTGEQCMQLTALATPVRVEAGDFELG
jgi:DNA-binding MarR family transcriptional regulator